MKITVVGASRLIGTKVVELLTNEGNDVVTPARSSGVAVLTAALAPHSLVTPD